MEVAASGAAGTAHRLLLTTLKNNQVPSLSKIVRKSSQIPLTKSKKSQARKIYREIARNRYNKSVRSNIEHVMISFSPW